VALLFWNALRGGSGKQPQLVAGTVAYLACGLLVCLLWYFLRNAHS
jgi:hypothetical protein